MFARNVNLSKISYGVATTLSSGAKYIRVSYDRAPFQIQTPEMYVPFGVNAFSAPGAPVKYSLNLAFKDIDIRPELQEFQEMLKNLDDKLIDDAFDGTLQAHKQKFSSREVVKEFYTSSIKCRDEKFPPNFKVTLPIGAAGEFTFPTYMVDPKTQRVVMDPETGKPKKVNLAELEESGQTKRCHCAVIMQCTGVWVAGSKNFGCTWKVTQMRIRPNASTKEDYAFKNVDGMTNPANERDLEDEDEDFVTSMSRPHQANVTNGNGESIEDDESMDGDDPIETVAETSADAVKVEPSIKIETSDESAPPMAVGKGGRAVAAGGRAKK
jgi:hypothetical protein